MKYSISNKSNSLKSKKSTKKQEVKETPKINVYDIYLETALLDQIIKESEIPKITSDEKTSELFYETYNGKGKFIFNNNLLYYGGVKYGILENQKELEEENCEIIFPEGTIYHGEIRNNEITGNGKFYFPTGAVYEGEILNGLRNGLGIYYSPTDSIKYDGMWKNGLKHGQGTMIKKGCKYSGNWYEGKIQGYGRMYWESGNFYTGNFLQGKIDGDGYMIWLIIPMEQVSKATGKITKKMDLVFSLVMMEINLKDFIYMILQ